MLYLRVSFYGGAKEKIMHAKYSMVMFTIADNLFPLVLIFVFMLVNYKGRTLYQSWIIWSIFCLFHIKGKIKMNWA